MNMVGRDGEGKGDEVGNKVQRFNILGKPKGGEKIGHTEVTEGRLKAGPQAGGTRGIQGYILPRDKFIYMREKN